MKRRASFIWGGAVMAAIIELGGGCATVEPSKLIAHRGESILAPENTVPAYKLAWANRGAFAVETDVYLSADKVLVCMHDENTQRTTGVEAQITQLSLAEIKKLDAGSWKSAACVNTPVPTLAEVLATLPADGHIFVEIKKSGAEFNRAYREALRQSGVRANQITFISFVPEALAEVKKAFPENPALLLLRIQITDGRPAISAPELIARLNAGNFDGADLGAGGEITAFDAAYIKALHDAGKRVYFWTVDDTAKAQTLIANGADGITTNRPGAMFKELGRD